MSKGRSIKEEFLICQDQKLDSISFPNSRLGPSLRATLLSANQFLTNQVERNKKYIQSLESILAWVSSCSQSCSQEISTLMLSYPTCADQFDYELRLASELNKFICKSKYFSFTVELSSVSLKVIPIDKRISLEVKVFTSDQVPKQIVHTMQGKPIIRGRNIETMIYHPSEEKFLVRIKMQITEVSSHFINGCVNLIVSNANESQFSIKPLVIKDLVIKAKEKTCKRWREQLF